MTEFTADEKAVLANLPRKNYLLQNERAVLCSLVDLLLAYTYDHITTGGDPTCESAWTAVKLSPTLCWLDSPESLQQVVVAFYRRVCSFPLHRNFALAQRCLKDVSMLLQSGVKVVVRCLLALKRILDRGEWVYILCKLYIDPYIVWLQSTSADALFALGAELIAAISGVKKGDVGLDLPSIEECVAQAMAEGDA